MISTIDRAWRPAVAGFFAFLLFSGVAAVLTGGRSEPSSSTKQPVAFNHKKHVQELELSCLTCHVSYEKEAFSGLPGADICSGCHSEPQGKSKEEAKLVRLIQAGAPLQWQSLFRQPAHVFYSHRRHVVVAKLECVTCHGSIAKTTTPPESVRRLRMQDCIDCHRRLGARTDCTNCHR
jgi:hypothetical protein